MFFQDWLLNIKTTAKLKLNTFINPGPRYSVFIIHDFYFDFWLSDYINFLTINRLCNNYSFQRFRPIFFQGFIVWWMCEYSKDPFLFNIPSLSYIIDAVPDLRSIFPESTVVNIFLDLCTTDGKYQKMKKSRRSVGIFHL